MIEWLELSVRWLHVIFGAAWIGTSFYFNWLNHHMRPPVDEAEAAKGVDGELWSVHGGHFYRVIKYGNAPPQMPKILHWFKYEAYFTWITGACLLALVYYLDSTVFMANPDAFYALPGWGTVVLGIGTLVVGWVIYDLLCKSPLGKNPVVFGIVGFVLASLVAFGLTQMIGSRAAYIHVGAMLGTMMAWNVFFVIIPNQKITVASLTKGDVPDPRLGQEASQRSLHNNYMTLPVLFIMVSNHYPSTFGHDFNWAILMALSLIGAGVRHYFNLKGKGKDAVWILPVAAVAMVALALVSQPRDLAKDAAPVSFSEVRPIIEQRCQPCHSATPTFPGFEVPPKNVILDTKELIKRYSAQINTQVSTKVMPPGNLTEITEEEREKLIIWFLQGADIEEAPQP